MKLNMKFGLKLSLQCTAAVVGVLLLSAPAPGAPSAGARRLPSQNGRIVYRMTGTGAAATNSTISMTWTDYGKRFRQDTQMRMAGNPRMKMKPMAMNSWTVCDGKSLVIAMPGPQRRAMRMKLPPNFDSQMMLGGGMGMAGMGSGGSKIVGRGSVLGKPCVIRTITMNTSHMNSRSKVWMWQNLPLRTEMAMQFKPVKRNPASKSPPMRMPPMKMTMVATQLSTAVRPTASMFRVPAGYTIQDMGQPGRPRGRTGR